MQQRTKKQQRLTQSMFNNSVENSTEEVVPKGKIRLQSIGMPPPLIKKEAPPVNNRNSSKNR